MMSTMLEAIVTEIKAKNPQASAEEVSNAVVRFMEKDILPVAFKQMRVPEPISSAQQLRQKMFLQRVKLKRRRAIQTRIKESKRLASEFEYVKRELRRIDVDTDFVTPTAFYGDSTNQLWRGATSISSVTRGIFLKKDGFPIDVQKEVREKKRELSRLFQLSTPIPKEIEEPEIFFIDKTVQVVAMSDPLFAKNLSIIEKTARTFALESRLEISFSVSLRRDIEIPDWRKLVLDIHTRDVDFDQKMKLWDEFDARIRKGIQEKIEISQGIEKEKLEELKKTFFTHFDLA
jgi:hypothetical protein